MSGQWEPGDIEDDYSDDREESQAEAWSEEQRYEAECLAYEARERYHAEHPEEMPTLLAALRKGIRK